MKPQSFYAPTRTPTDSAAMTAAVDLAEGLGLTFCRPHPSQLKFADVSYYPNTRRLVRDGQKGRTNVSLDDLRELLTGRSRR